MKHIYELPRRASCGGTVVLPHVVSVSPIGEGYLGITTQDTKKGHDKCWFYINTLSHTHNYEMAVTALVADEPAGFDSIEEACSWLESERTKLLEAIEESYK